jgi:hypothetical protein
MKESQSEWQNKMSEFILEFKNQHKDSAGNVVDQIQQQLQDTMRSLIKEEIGKGKVPTVEDIKNLVQEALLQERMGSSSSSNLPDTEVSWVLLPVCTPTVHVCRLKNLSS